MPPRTSRSRSPSSPPAPAPIVARATPDLSLPVTRSFRLGELLRSESAERQPELKSKQENPPAQVLENLTYLATTALQPLRDRIGAPVHINSGYRCAEVNALIGGVANSQHVLGEAADCQLSSTFLTDDGTAGMRESIRAGVRQLVGRPLRPDVSENFYLFAYVCLRLEELDIDQVIHEYGNGYGRPSWVHVAASRRQSKRQILFIGEYSDRKYLTKTVAEALALGT